MEKSGPSGWARYAFWASHGFRQDGENKVTFGFNNGGHVRITANEPTKDDTWVHLVGTYDKTMVRLYLDGSLEAEEKQSGDVTTNDHPLYIGADPVSPDKVFVKALIDDVRIYDRGLSQTEVEALFNEGK